MQHSVYLIAGVDFFWEPVVVLLYVYVCISLIMYIHMPYALIGRNRENEYMDQNIH